MITLEKLIGREIVAFVPFFDKVKWQHLKLINVEAAGIWVENRAILETILKVSGVTVTPKTAVFFLPFQQITFVLDSLDVPYISNEALK
jgi:hypothetical protein